MGEKGRMMETNYNSAENLDQEKFLIEIAVYRRDTVIWNS